MQAGRNWLWKSRSSFKRYPKEGDKIVILSGENITWNGWSCRYICRYRKILNPGIDLNAVQKSNPEMQKSAANAETWKW